MLHRLAMCHRLVVAILLAAVFVGHVGAANQADASSEPALCPTSEAWVEMPLPERLVRSNFGSIPPGIRTVTFAWPSEEVIFVGGLKVHRTNDCGAHWRTWNDPRIAGGEPLPGWYGNTRVASGLGVIFAVGGALGILRSADSGETWSTGAPADPIMNRRYRKVYAGSIAASPNSRYDVYASLELVSQQGVPGLGYSIDGGETWNSMYRAGHGGPLLQDALVPTRVYSVFNGKELMVSNWYGTTFESVGAVFEPLLPLSEKITALAMSPDGEQFLLGTGAGVIYMREPDGVWRLAHAHPERSGIVDMSLSSSRLLVVDADGRLWHTRPRTS